MPTESPLTPEQKLNIVTQLKTCNKDGRLIDILLEAACAGKRFPKPFYDQLSDYQLIYLREENDTVKAHLKETIKLKITEDILPEFKQLRDNYQKENDWPTEFIHFLAEKLSITIETPEVVQAALKDGKIYWRVKKGDEVLYDRQTAKQQTPFPFTPENSFEITWEQFRLLKDTGKRRGTVQITKARFINYFPEEKRDQAKAVWKELKTEKLINAKNRLSDKWRAITNVEIPLTNLNASPHVVSKATLIDDILKPLRGDGRSSKKIKKQNFIAQCNQHIRPSTDTKYEAIWNHLIAADALVQDGASKFYKIKLLFSQEAVLDPVHITYHDVAQALHTIANDKTKKEKIDPPLNQTIFRPERSEKNWTNSNGRIENKHSIASRTALWDVAIYNELTTHRHSDGEQVKIGDGILEYDHIPTGALLRDFVRTEIAPLKAEIKELSKKQTALEDNLEDLKKSPKKNKKIIEATEEELAEKREKLRKAEAKYGDENSWFTIAIPEQLHSQGVSFLADLKTQKNKIIPLVSELKAYLHILATRPKEVGFEDADKKYILFLLAAFRHLYRCQIKKAPETRWIGSAPHAFFVAHKETMKNDKGENLDEIFTEEIRKALALTG